MSARSIALFSFVAAATARQFTVVNKCSYTVWPAVYTTPLPNNGFPDVETGWEAPPGHTKTFSAPDNWRSGRIWGRTGCDFSTSLPGPTQCATGGCNGGLLCDPQSGTGVPPASLAEWTLGGTPPNDGDGIDWYDVSLVDGSNIPMRIEPTAGCPVADCPADLNVDCPDPIADKDGSGKVIGCKSACLANLDGNTGGDSPLCCSGSHNTPQTCPPGGITFYDHFKKGCPNSYVYAYDESSGTALWTCDTKSTKPDYTLTFCPDGDDGSAPAPAPAPSPDPAPAPSPDPTPAPSPDPAPAPSSDPAPAPSPDPAPSPSPDPAPAPEPTEDPAPAPEPSTTDPAPAPSPTKTCKPKPKPSSTLVPSSSTSASTSTSAPSPTLIPNPPPASSTSVSTTPTPAASTSTSAPSPTLIPNPPPVTKTSSTSAPAPTSSAPSAPGPSPSDPPKSCPPSRKRALRKAKRALEQRDAETL